MSTNVKPIPDGYPTLSASLTCKDAKAAIEFYKKVFGAQGNPMMMQGPDGKVMHSELTIGDSKIMVVDEFPGMAMAPVPGAGNPMSLFLYTQDVDKVFNHAVAEGAKAIMPPMNMFWGDRFCKLIDPAGHAWSLATHVEDVAPDEMQRRMKAEMERMSQPSGQAKAAN